MTQIGWHFQGGVPGWAPGIVNAGWNKMMDPGDRDPFPGRATVGRTYVDDGASNLMVMEGARGAETWFAANRQAYERAPWISAWEGPNEPPVSRTEQRRALSAFTTRLAELLHWIGRKIVGLNLSVGWPDLLTAADLGPCLAACDYVGLHEYSAPTMQSEAGWYCLRYRRTVEEWRNAGYNVPPILITELGIDGGVIGRPRTGWKSYCSEEEYAEQLRWYLGETRKDSLVAGMMVFTAAPIGWDDFEVGESLSRRIAAINEEEPEEPMADPRAENCRGYRLENGLVTGVNLDYLSLPTSRFELKNVTLIPQGQSGDTTTATITVLDKSGLPAEVPVILAWPWAGSPSMPNQALPGNASRPVQHMITNGYDAAAGHKGPLAIYLAASGSSRQTPISDVIGGLGLPNNRHVSYVLTFQERGAPPDEPGPGDLAAVVAELKNVNKNLGIVAELIRTGFRL